VFQNATCCFFWNKIKLERTVKNDLNYYLCSTSDMVSVDLLKTVKLGKDIESIFEFGALMVWIHP
jgi:hypothetical protein